MHGGINPPSISIALLTTVSADNYISGLELFWMLAKNRTGQKSTIRDLDVGPNCPWLIAGQRVQALSWL